MSLIKLHANLERALIMERRQGCPVYFKMVWNTAKQSRCWNAIKQHERAWEYRKILDMPHAHLLKIPLKSLWQRGPRIEWIWWVARIWSNFSYRTNIVYWEKMCKLLKKFHLVAMETGSMLLPPQIPKKLPEIHWGRPIFTNFRGLWSLKLLKIPKSEMHYMKQ